MLGIFSLMFLSLSGQYTDFVFDIIDFNTYMHSMLIVQLHNLVLRLKNILLL